MVQVEPHLVTFVKLVDEIPVLAKIEKRNRGRPKTYAKRLILKAFIVVIVRHLYTDYSPLGHEAPHNPVTQTVYLPAAVPPSIGKIPPVWSQTRSGRIV